MSFAISNFPLPFSIPLIFKKKIIIAEEYSKDAISLNLLPTQQIRRATLSRSNEPDTRDRSASFAPSLSFSLCEEIVRTIRCGRKKRRRRRRGGEKKLAGSYLTATERCGPFYLPPPLPSASLRYLESHEVLGRIVVRGSRIQQPRDVSIKFPGTIASYDRPGHVGCEMPLGHASSRVRCLEQIAPTRWRTTQHSLLR